MPDFQDSGQRGQPSSAWHLDRKVPVSIIAAMLMQAAGGVWFVSKLDARIAAVELQQVTQKERDKAQDDRVAEAVAQVRRQLELIDSKLDRLIERRVKP